MIVISTQKNLIMLKMNVIRKIPIDLALFFLLYVFTF